MFVKELKLIKGQEQKPRRIHMSVDGFEGTSLHPVVSVDNLEELEDCLLTLIYEAAYRAGESPIRLSRRLNDIVRRSELERVKGTIRAAIPGRGCYEG